MKYAPNENKWIVTESSRYDDQTFTYGVFPTLNEAQAKMAELVNFSGGTLDDEADNYYVDTASAHFSITNLIEIIQ